jgi:hypothetical protein
MWLKEKIVWNPRAVEHLAKLAEEYKAGGTEVSDKE